MHGNTYIYQIKVENQKAANKVNKYFLEAYAGIQFRHGGVGNTDAEAILRQEGYRPLQLPDGRGVLLPLHRWLTANRLVRSIPKDAVLIVHHPIYPRMYRYLVRRLLKKNIRVVLLIADIDGLKDGDQQALAKELSLFRDCKNFIVHNASMEAFIRNAAPGARVVQLGPFDFLAAPFEGTRSPDQGINFSGNLSKSPFLEKVGQIPALQFHVYGEGCSAAMLAQPNLQYHGVYPPQQLPSIIQGSYGLIWDGGALAEPADSMGRYMQYIHHHKLSLYILAGMPVIAPAFSGSADFICDHQIGWLVHSLTEIPELLQSIDPSTYAATRRRLAPLASQISKGMQLRRALNAFQQTTQGQRD
jgi:hypothetical protein